MNKSFKCILIFCLFLVVHSKVFSQNVETKFKESLQEADEYLLTEEYADALFLLTQVEKDGYTNANVQYKIGICYLNSTHEKLKSIAYLEKASRNIAANYNSEDVTEKKAPAKALLFLGDAYKLNNRLKDAEKAYGRYLELIRENKQEQAIVEKRIFETKVAQHLMKQPNGAVFEKLGPEINKGMGNMNACISGDGRSLVFGRKMKFYDAIFYCTRNGNAWTEPKEIITQLGSDGEFHPTALSVDGTRMLLTSFLPEAGTDIYESFLKEGKWQKVRRLEEPMNSRFYDVDATYSPDGKYIYFASNRSGGLGGFDLYRTAIDENGNIGVTENLGKSINTELDERSPSFMDNGKILIFSSQRKPGMGGLDFFYTELDSGLKSNNVYNFGYPVSTVTDDIGLSTVNSAKEGVIAKVFPESRNDGDIYSIRFDTLSRFKLVPISGLVNLKGTDSLSYGELTLVFVDEDIHDTIGRVEVPEAGKYSVDLYPGNFKLVMFKNGDSVTNHFTIPLEFNDQTFSLVSEFIKPIKPELREESSMTLAIDTIFVSDILFSYNKAIISLEEAKKLESIIKSLQNYTILRVDLVGYTDNKGTEDYNIKLSKQRAEAVSKFLKQRGVSVKVINAKGMGAANAVAKNNNEDGTDNPEGRSYNRRVELVIQVNDPNVVLFKKNQVPGYLKP